MPSASPYGPPHIREHTYIYVPESSHHPATAHRKESPRTHRVFLDNRARRENKVRVYLWTIINKFQNQNQTTRQLCHAIIDPHEHADYREYWESLFLMSLFTDTTKKVKKGDNIEHTWWLWKMTVSHKYTIKNGHQMKRSLASLLAADGIVFVFRETE